MRQLLNFLTALLVLMTATSVSATPTETEAEITRLRTSLASAGSPKDSVTILYNIFDLCSSEQQPPVGRQLFETARRAGDYTSCLDILRLISNSLDDREFYQKITDAALSLPESKDRYETVLFLKMRRLSFDVKHMKEETRQKAIVDILSEKYLSNKESGNNKDIEPKYEAHEQLLKLYTLVQYLRNVSSGDMLKEYLDQLSELANSPEIELYAIRNLVNTEAANIYCDAGDYKKSLNADRHMLEIIRGLEKEYAAKGRKYRNYDLSRYLIYERMIRNYKGLTSDEVDDLYKKCLEMASSQDEIKTMMETTPRFYAFYHMAKGDYNAAIPQLKEYLKMDIIGPQARKIVLENLIEAADKTGDMNTKLEALTQYNTILEELNKTNAADKYKELQIKYDVESLRSKNAALELENKEDDIRSAKRIMTFVIAAFIILFIVIVLALFNWRNNKLTASRLGKIADNLNRERRIIRNSIYSDSFEIVSGMNNEEIEKLHSWQTRMKKNKSGYNDMSTFIATSIINDLLYISSFGRDMRTRFIHSVSVDSLLRKLETTVNSDNDRHGVLNIEYPDKDFKIVTDSECLLSLMTHVMTTALEASPVGSVSLSVNHIPDYSVNFIITIDGRSSASSSDPRILEGYIIKNRILEREDFGMFLCRMIMLLLGTTHYPDPMYKKGARYIFSLKESRDANSSKK